MIKTSLTHRMACLTLFAALCRPGTAAEPSQGPTNAAALSATNAVAEKKGGMILVERLEKPKNLPKFEQKELAGYVLIYFKDQTQCGNLAVSKDGYTFVDLNGGQPVFDGTLLAEQKGVRDPHIARGPDGAFYVVMTDLHIFGQRAGFRETQWQRPADKYGWGNNRAIVMMKSWDLVHWSHADFRVDSAFPDLGDIDCSWAPETVYDEKEGKMMVYFTIRYNNKECHIYYSYANDDFTKLETTPKRISETGGIDGDITQVGDKFHLFFASDSKIRHGVSDSINAGYITDTNRVDPETVATEAPTVFKRLGTDKYVLMYDVFGGRPGNMGFSETTDFTNYTNLGRFNQGVMKTVGFDRPKHGAVTYVTSSELKAIADYWKIDLH